MTEICSVDFFSCFEVWFSSILGSALCLILALNVVLGPQPRESFSFVLILSVISLFVPEHIVFISV